MPTMPAQFQLLAAWFQARVGLLHDEDNRDRGEILQTVVVISLFVAAAILIVGILVTKATDTANGVQTQ
ncbi:hypothetical protein SAMN05892883_2256 [Jatrophihabitans sp. GAS493]|uniref:hypothetical protein n=1 Tax=Jatrophihabitans sp. GAS493 TaxID=1907575 RepID=UPI000BC07C5C|nr:hypothetical protein [Jatrophihabitans sp. GAS493]SOD72944.1 hypothetical protein SAMN05892883_2256 [Jatrophihabitans sp. GAS493]